MNNRTYIESDGLTVEVLMIEEKTKFGRTMVKVQPVSGSGEKWVNKESIIHSASQKKVVKKYV
jgi:hypothetical protein